MSSREACIVPGYPASGQQCLYRAQLTTQHSLGWGRWGWIFLDCCHSWNRGVRCTKIVQGVKQSHLLRRLAVHSTSFPSLCHRHSGNRLPSTHINPASIAFNRIQAYYLWKFPLHKLGQRTSWSGHHQPLREDKPGEGGRGEVYRAEDGQLKREVASKILAEQFAQDAQRLARFEREAQLLAFLKAFEKSLQK